MKLLKSSLLGSAAALMAVGAGHAADLPVKKAVPIEFVRVCSTYGAGFFYIPGTDTCLRLSGRARAEMGYVSNENRAVGTQVGDVSQYRGLLRINLDARTQTEYGTLRAFIRADIASASGTYLTSGTRQRVSEAFPALGVDQFGRTQMYVNADKAFIQFAGLTAGRASSFFDFYAHDFEMVAGSGGSDVFSTNLLAYTATVGNGLSATISIEDPNYRHNNLFNAGVSTSGVIGTSSASIFGGSTAPTGLILGTNANGATIVTFQDVIERSRLPDFVGVLRYDQAWGSAQLSAAAKDINIGGSGNANGLPSVLSTAAVGNVTAFQAQALAAARGISGGPKTTEGFAVQGGVKINMPFIAPGDALYLQGAYGLGANNYAGVASYTGQYQVSATPTNGGPFQQYLADAVVNPLTGKIQLTEAFSVVGSYLHYWTPQWRSAFFASYSQTNFGKGARAAESLLVGNTLGTTTGGVFTASGAIGGGAASVISPVGNSAALYALSPVLRDNYQIYAGANLIWSPVKDLDIGAEGVYLNSGVLNGRVLDSSKTAGVTAANFNALAAAGAIKTVRSYDATQIRFRVQRDF